MPGPTDALGYSPGSPFYRAPSAGGYNITPSPLSGQGAYGQVPGLLGLPNPAGDLGQQFPALSGANDAAGQALLAKLQGRVSPGTTNALQTAAAQLGVQQGMPGLAPGSINMHNLFGNIAGFSENQQQQGIQDYNALIPTISRTQTVSPELQSEIASRNALNLAAPNPQQAQSLAQQLFNNYLGSMRGGGRTSGLPTGTSTFDPYVTRPFASQALNPSPMGGAGRLGGNTPYANQSNFGGYGGSSFGGYGGAIGGAGGMDEYNWIANQGFDPMSYGVFPGGGYTNITPGTASPGGSGYDQFFPPPQQGPNLPVQYGNPAGPSGIDDFIDEYGF